jgi:hypothetical protein
MRPSETPVGVDHRPYPGKAADLAARIERTSITGGAGGGTLSVSPPDPAPLPNRDVAPKPEWQPQVHPMEPNPPTEEQTP